MYIQLHGKLFGAILFSKVWDESLVAHKSITISPDSGRLFINSQKQMID